MRVVFVAVGPGPVESTLEGFLAAAGDRHDVTAYRAGDAISDQFEGLDAVVDFGGWASNDLIDNGADGGARLWQVLGYGLDHIDVGHVLQRGLLLAHTPGEVTAVPLAEHALFLMLSLEKKLHEGQRSLRSGVFYTTMAGELAGKTLAIIGLGASGRALARRAIGLEMRTLAVDVAEIPRSVQHELQIAFCGGLEDLHHVLAQADFVSIHTPLTSTTHHLIDTEALGVMKSDAALINVARGAVIDERALIAALQEGRIGGAGLDVFEREPLDSGHPLFDLENVVLTPHIAGTTPGSSRRRALFAAENIDRLARGLPPEGQITTVW